MQNSNHKFQRSSAVLSSKIDSDIVLLDDKANAYFSMNEVGTSIWELLHQPKSIAELTEELRKIFDGVDSQAEGEMISFLDQLLSRNLIHQVE